MSIVTERNGRKKLYIPTCDFCGKELPEENDWQDAVDSKKIHGWRSTKVDGEWMDQCTDCQETWGPQQ